MNTCDIDPITSTCRTDHAELVRTGEVCGFCYQPGHTYEDGYHPVVRMEDAFPEAVVALMSLVELPDGPVS